GGDDGLDLLAVLDVAGVEADLVDAGVDRFEGALEVEVDVGDDGHADLREDVAQGVGVFLFGDGGTDGVRPGGRQAGDPGGAAGDVVGVSGSHGVEADRRVTAALHDADAAVSDADLPGFSPVNHGRIIAARPRCAGRLILAQTAFIV